MRKQGILAERLQKTVHVSPLRYRIEQLRREFPCEQAACIEDWLVLVANGRGTRVVVPAFEPAGPFTPPPLSVFSNEDLVTAICQLNCLDRPQMLRLAAQLISRGAIDVEKLRLPAERERAEPVLAELSRLALRVAPDHEAWKRVHDLFVDQPPLREPLLHWTRLAEPVMKDGRCNAASWRLVA